MEVKPDRATSTSTPRAMIVFERRSGEPLTKGVPALYTKDAYYKHVTKRVEIVAAQMADEETWVLDERC